MEKRILMHPYKPHATSQPSRLSHIHKFSTDSPHNHHRRLLVICSAWWRHAYSSERRTTAVYWLHEATQAYIFIQNGCYGHSVCRFFALSSSEFGRHYAEEVGRKSVETSARRILANQFPTIQVLPPAKSLVAIRGYGEPALQKVVPCVRMWSNVWSQELTNAAAVGRFAGSRSRHRITVRFSPRSFCSRCCVASLDPSHGSSARPAMAS